MQRLWGGRTLRTVAPARTRHLIDKSKVEETDAVSGISTVGHVSQVAERIAARLAHCCSLILASSSLLSSSFFLVSWSI